MSKSKLKCRQCEERFGEAYKPSFESLSNVCDSVDEYGNFGDEVGRLFVEYYCPYCNQTLELE